MKKLIPLAVLLSVSCVKLFAQDDLANKKFENVQATNLLAPDKIKIDGNLTDWDNNFQAYNKATKLYYTLSNDDKNLYLIVKSIEPNNNTKITAGGITLTINTDNKKKEQDAYSLTYPVVAAPTPGQRGQRGAGGPGGAGGFGGGGFGGAGGFGRNTNDSAALAAQATARKQLVSSSKEIRVTGFKDITDSLISIYNEHSIKTAITYDAQNSYTYEAAIPLKLLGLSVENAKEFAYQVKVNGRQLPNFQNRNDGGGFAGGGAGGFGGAGGGGGAGGFGGGGGGARGGGGGGGARGGGGGRGGAGNIDFAELASPSDFWGKYTLAKKNTPNN